MNRLCIYFLAFLTFWVSTWMVTDIHDWSLVDTAQASHSVLHVSQSCSDIQTSAQSHNQHYGACSYDHGGHIGHTLAARTLTVTHIPEQETVHAIPLSRFWYSRKITPALRPPIA